MTVVTHPVNSKLQIDTRMLCITLVWNWIRCSENFLSKKKDSIHMQLESDLLCQLWINWKWFLKAINVFSLFRNKGGSFLCEQALFPFTQRCFVHSLTKIRLVVLENILKVDMYFSYFAIIIPFERVDFSFAKTVLSLFWLKLFQLVWRRRWRCERFTDRQTDRRTDKRRSE